MDTSASEYVQIPGACIAGEVLIGTWSVSNIGKCQMLCESYRDTDSCIGY